MTNQQNKLRFKMPEGFRVEMRAERTVAGEILAPGQEVLSQLQKLPKELHVGMQEWFASSDVPTRMLCCEQNHKGSFRLSYYFAESNAGDDLILWAQKGSTMDVSLDLIGPTDADGAGALRLRILAEPGACVRLIQAVRFSSGFSFSGSIAAHCKKGACVKLVQPLFTQGKTNMDVCANGEGVFECYTGVSEQNVSRLHYNCSIETTGHSCDDNDELLPLVEAIQKVDSADERQALLGLAMQNT